MNKDMEKRFERIHKKIEEIDNHKTSHKSGNTIVFVIMGILLASMLVFAGGITGWVTFSEDTIKNNPENFVVEQTRTVIVDAIPGSNALLISGEVRGEGKASVFLLVGDKKYLVYHYEGKNGEKFTDACYGSCSVEKFDKAKLLFELEGTKVVVTNIKYVAPRLIGFDLSPKKLIIDYKKTPAMTFDVTVKNEYEKDFDVILFVDGPLSDSFSWTGSLVHFNGEKQKTVRVNVVLPDRLDKGEYANKITARYIPPDGRNFVGSSPKEEMIVLVKN